MGESEAAGQGRTWGLPAFYTVWLGLELAFIYFFYVETRGATLEEVAKIVDGEEAQVAHVDLSLVEKETGLEGQYEQTADEKSGLRERTKAI